VNPLLAARSVLAIQPHYDDNDIACGGTIAALAGSGASVHYVTVTDDLAGVLDPDLDDAAATAALRAEQLAAGRHIGVTDHTWMGRPDAGPFNHHELRDELIAIIRATRPDVVMTCDPWLVDEGHQDHVRTGLAAVEAAMLAGLPRLCRSTPDPAWTVATIALCYTQRPNVIVDTSAVQTARHSALDCYRAQFTAEDLDALRSLLDAHERSLATDGATHGEALCVLPTAAFHCGLADRTPIAEPIRFPSLPDAVSP